jgi:hypothetical protein
MEDIVLMTWYLLGENKEVMKAQMNLVVHLLEL